MNYAFTIFIIIFFLIYTIAHYYIGIRLLTSLSPYLPLKYASTLLWTSLVFLGLIYPLGRFAEKRLPPILADTLVICGSYWLGILFYLFLGIFITDLLFLIARYVPVIPAIATHHTPFSAILILLFVSILTVYGSINARHPVLRHYQLNIPKMAGELSSLRVVMVSDIHLGKFVGTDRLRQLIATINTQQPDIVFLVGDIIDEDVDLFLEQKMPDVLVDLHAPFGTYAVLGNHEYIGRKPETAVRYLQQAGLTILRDQTVKVKDSFYVIGRDDVSSQRFNGKPRQTLAQILQPVDKSLPLFLLDHQPSNLTEADNEHIDVQFSGHTHRGQLFPLGLITRLIYEKDWGYLHKDYLQLIVSCGYGTWGPPLRIGNRPEIVICDISFIKPH